MPSLKTLTTMAIMARRWKKKLINMPIKPEKRVNCPRCGCLVPPAELEGHVACDRCLNFDPGDEGSGRNTKDFPVTQNMKF